MEMKKYLVVEWKKYTDLVNIVVYEGNNKQEIINRYYDEFAIGRRENKVYVEEFDKLADGWYWAR